MKTFSHVMFAGLMGLCSLSLNTQAQSSSSDAYFLSPLRGTFLQVDPSETVTHRRVNFRATSCVGKRQIIRSDFKIERFAVLKNGLSLKVERHEDDPNCFAWYDSIDHDYYSAEGYSQVKYEVLVNDTVLAQSLFVNPWDDKFTFAVDPRDNVDLKEVLDRRGGEPVLEVKSAHLIKTALVDVRVAASILLEAKVFKKDRSGNPIRDRDGKVIEEFARDGEYTLSVDVLNRNHQTVQQMIQNVEVKNGMILANLLFDRDVQAIPRDVLLRCTIVPAPVNGPQKVSSEAVTMQLENN